MAERAQTEGAAPDGAQEAMAAPVAEHAGAAARSGVAPDSPEALAVVERLETMTMAAAVAEHAGAVARSGVAPDSPEALAVVERLETMTAGVPEGREAAAERIDAFTDDRVARYWTLVGIHGWPQERSTE